MASANKLPCRYSMSNSANEHKNVPPEKGRGSLTANKACLPCRARKVKCDAAVIGFPCSSCTSRQSTEDCILQTRKIRKVRKSRTRELTHVSPTSEHTPAISDGSQAGSLGQSNQSNQPDQSNQSLQLTPPPQSPELSASDTVSPQVARRSGPDLLYLNILNDAVKKETHHNHRLTSDDSGKYPTSGDSLTPRNCLWNKLPQLDDVDNEYLMRKGVFDLPDRQYLDVLVKTYFTNVYPFVPAINRVEFVRRYQSGDCSLFLLCVILTPATIHASAEVLSACGFPSRSVAQEYFFTKVKLLHDFGVEDDTLILLQASIILCMVILDHPSNYDFGYWFHNAVRLATKLDIRTACIRQDKPRKLLKCYRRIWWALHSLDIFHVSVNTRRSRLLEDSPQIKPRSEEDWEEEEVSAAFSDLLPPISLQERMLPVVHSELFRIVAQSLAMVMNKPPQDPHQLWRPFDVWRKSLATKLYVDENADTDLYYLNILALSYRFECILCRLIRRQWLQPTYAEYVDRAKQRLRSAILELDMIAMRVLPGGNLHEFPVTFMTTMTALLSLHIESALDPTEMDLVHSMARISISQTMLVLTQGKEVPAVKGALPVFEEILVKKNLYTAPTAIYTQVPVVPESSAQGQSHDQSESYALPQAQTGIFSSQLTQDESAPSIYGDFLGLEFFCDWGMGVEASSVNLNMASEESV